MTKSSDIIANRVFIGCPWKTIRVKYVEAVRKLEHAYPIHFILIGREKDQRAEELLNLIKRSLRCSTMAIFDVTGGNANVSLEYGFADASDIDRVLYLNTHERNRESRQDTSIIADLAGQRRKQYKNESTLKRFLNEFCKEHTFTKRFETALRKVTRNVKTRHAKKKYRTLSIKVIRFFDEKEKGRRSDLTEHLLAGGYSETEIEFTLKGLHGAGLINISTGRYADIRIN